MITDQAGIDYTMIGLDGTKNKSNLGANAILGVSLACARAAAQYTNQYMFRYIGGVNACTLPIPMMNILNGGQHADNKIDIQEFMIMPVGADSFSEALRMGVEIFHSLKMVLKEKKCSTNVGDEGGFAPDLASNEEAIETVIKAVEKAGYKAGSDVYLAVDAAASSFYLKKEKKYRLASLNKKFTTEKMVEFWIKWAKAYPIISIEDGFAEDDWTGFAELTKAIGMDVQIVGDDLYVTNVERLQKGINEKSTNSILIKVNQIGTLTETINTVRLADVNGFTSVISHRSGETEDTSIADLAVALNTGQIKTGSASRTDRTAKYNQLLRIEEILGGLARYPGKNFKFVR
jgi:enolase